MSPSRSLAPRQPASLETVHNILGSLVARYRQEEVLTAVRQIPARDAKFRPMPGWVTSALSEAYRAKGIKELYSHQAATAELVGGGKNVVVVTPTASGKTLCYNLPVVNAVLENPDTRALYLFPTKALSQDQLAELQDLAKRLDDNLASAAISLSSFRCAQSAVTNLSQYGRYAAIIRSLRFAVGVPSGIRSDPLYQAITNT